MGFSVGNILGTAVGLEGEAVSILVGLEGIADGRKMGLLEGDGVGLALGFLEGEAVGFLVGIVGAADGVAEGLIGPALGEAIQIRQLLE